MQLSHVQLSSHVHLYACICVYTLLYAASAQAHAQAAHQKQDAARMKLCKQLYDEVQQLKSEQFAQNHAQQQAEVAAASGAAQIAATDGLTRLRAGSLASASAAAASPPNDEGAVELASAGAVADASAAADNGDGAAS